LVLGFAVEHPGPMLLAKHLKVGSTAHGSTDRDVVQVELAHNAVIEVPDSSSGSGPQLESSKRRIDRLAAQQSFYSSVHLVGLDQRGAIVLQLKTSRGLLNRRLANLPRCLIGIEACSGAQESVLANIDADCSDRGWR
jgi:hypothetical protein